MITAIIFLIVLAVLIFVHELGHFLTAKSFGIRVDAFAIGFGPKIFSWKRGETTYSLRLIPFGGYVKIFGETPDEESISGPDASRSFINKARWKQAIVLVAGITFNFIFAWLLYIIVFTYGVTATTDGFEKYADRFTNSRIMITEIMPGSPTEKAGIKVGDVIKNIDSNADKSVTDVQTYINAKGATELVMNVSRNGKDVSVKIIPVNGLVENKYAIGIAMQDVVDIRLPFFTSIYEGLRYTVIMIRDTAIGLYGFFSGIILGTASFADVSGPIGIAGIIGNAAGLGFIYLLMITAIISINLGLINLIPFPALDGGRILFVGIESIIRRRIPEKFTNIVNTIGFVLLMLLMVLVTYKDIVKLFK